MNLKNGWRIEKINGMKEFLILKGELSNIDVKIYLFNWIYGMFMCL